MSVLRLAWLNLVRHRTATALAVVALALTVACAGMLLRTARLADARFATVAHAGDALIAAKGGATDAVLGALNAEGPYPRFIPLGLFATMVNEAWYTAGRTAHASSVVPLVYAGKIVGKTGARARVPEVVSAPETGSSGRGGEEDEGNARAGAGSDAGRFSRFGELSGDQYRVAGTIEAFFAMPSPAPRLAYAAGGWTEEEAGVVIGDAVARRERLAVGDAVAVAHWTTDNMPSPAESGLRPRVFSVSGILAPTGTAWDRLVFTNLVQAQSLLEEALPVAGQKTVWNSYVLHYLIMHAVPGKADSLGAMIDQQTVTQVVPVAETREALRRLTATGRQVAAMMGLLSVILALITLSALMLGRFEGMTRQMTLLEATGWGKAELRRLVFWEGLMLGVAAVALGGALDALAFPLVRTLLGAALPDSGLVSSTVWMSAPVWAVTVAVTVCAAQGASWLVFRGRAQERLRALG